MKAVKDKIRFALWLKPETMEKIRAASAQDDCGSLSEFIEKAVLAYLGYDTKKNPAFVFIRTRCRNAFR